MFFRLSDACLKTIFYPNFLRARTFNPTTDNDCKNRYNRTIAETILREISTVHGMAFDGAKNLLHNLAEHLRNDSLVEMYGEQRINNLAAYLEIPIPYDAQQLSKAVSLANYLTQGNVFPAIRKLMQCPALTFEETSIVGLTWEINEAIRLSQTLSSEVEGLGNVSAGFAQSLKNYRDSLLSLKKYYESSRINTTSLMLPITNPDYVISNVTYSIYKGKILTQYEKSSYFQEADNDIGFTQFNDLKKIYIFFWNRK